MARVLYTGGIAGYRGKLAGSVYSRNKGGEYVKTKVTPLNPKTTYQSQQRANVSDLAKYYGTTLTDDQRTAWTNFGKSTNAKSVYGNGLILSGIAVFQKLNLIVLAAGGTLIDTPPIGLNVPSITTASLDVAITIPTFKLTFTPTPLVTPQGLYLWATPALSAGISNFGTALRYIGFTDAATSPLSIGTLWSARFGAVPTSPGQRIGVNAQVVDPTTGAISAGFRVSTIVAA